MIALILAVWASLVWSSPGGQTLRAERITPDGVTHPITLWDSTFARAITIPAAAGTTQGGFVSLTEAESIWRAGGQAIRLVVGDGVQESAGNLVVYAAGVRDTLYRDVAGSSWRRPAAWQGPGNGWESGWARAVPCRNRPDIRCATCSRLAPLDSLLAGSGRFLGLGPLVHQEVVQQASRDALCGAYGYVALRGVRDSSDCRP